MTFSNIITSAQKTAKRTVSIRSHISQTIAKMDIDDEDKKKLRTWTHYSSAFGLCNSSDIQGISDDLAKNFFTNSNAYALHRQKSQVKSACSQKACGAVQAFTTVPPLGGELVKLEKSVVGSATGKWADLKGSAFKPNESNWSTQATGDGSYLYKVGRKIRFTYTGTVDSGDALVWREAKVESVEYDWQSPSYGITIREVDSSGGTSPAVDWRLTFFKDNDTDLLTTLTGEEYSRSIDICGNAEITIKFFPTWASETIVENTSSQWMKIYMQLSGHSQQYAFRGGGAKKVGNITLGKGFSFPNLPVVTQAESLLNIIFGWLGGKCYAWSNADVSLPPVIGNYWNFEKSWYTKGAQALSGVAAVPLIGDVIGATLAETLGFIGSGFKPGSDLDKVNLSILYHKPVCKNFIINALTERAPYPGGAAHDYAFNVRLSYENRRICKLGWMPYGDRIVSKANTSDANRAAAFNNVQNKGDIGHFVPMALTRFYRQHVLNIFKGFYRDLMGELNIHPSPDAFVKKSGGAAGVPDILYSQTGGGKKHGGLKRGSSDPLMATQRLSGVCFPVIKTSGIAWKDFLVATSGDLPNFQPSGQQRESQDSGGNHSIFNDSITSYPSAFTEQYNKINLITPLFSDTPTEFGAQGDLTFICSAGSNLVVGLVPGQSVRIEVSGDGWG